MAPERGQGPVEERAYRAIEHSLERMRGEASVARGSDGRSFLRFPVSAPCPVDVRDGDVTRSGRLRALLWPFDPGRGHPEHALAAIYERMELSDAAARQGDWLLFEATLPCSVEVDVEERGTVVGELRAYRWPLTD